MKRFAVLLTLFVLLLIPSAQGQTDYVPYGCPVAIAAPQPEPRACIETQDWWVNLRTDLAAPDISNTASDFAFSSSHVHLMIPFPVGERMVLPASGGYSWPYQAQWHNNNGGTVRQVRGGGFQFGTCCPNDPNYKSVPITSDQQLHVGSIPIPSSVVDQWRSFTGKRENRFTADTTSKYLQRQYNSGAWNAFLNAAGQAVPVTGRGWYQCSDYTNVTLNTPVTAHGLASTGLPSTLSYSLAQGATFAFAYLDANIHAGSKGIVLFENRTGSTGSFTLPSLASGDHILLLGGWEKIAGCGWNGGLIRIPFHR